MRSSGWAQRLWAAFVVGASLAVAITGCGSSSSDNAGKSGGGDAAKKLKIAWVGVDFTNPLYASIRKEALKEAKLKGVELVTTGSNDAATQINAMQTYIGAKVDALGISALNQKAAIGIVDEAVKAGIPVVSVHGKMPGAKVSAAVSIDFVGIGKDMGKQIVDYCKSIDPCTVGLFVGSRGDDASVDVQNGVESVMKTSPNIKVVANPANGFDPNQAASATTDVLTKYPHINVLWYVWSAGVLAGIQSVKTAHMTGKVGVFSGSGVCPMLQADLNGTENGDVMLFTALEGKALVDTEIALARHQPVDKDQSVPTYAITPDSAKGILNGSVTPPADVAPFVTSALKEASSGPCPKA